MPPKTVIELQVAQNTKDIDNIGVTMEKMLEAIQGLRDDMSERSEKMIKMLADQNSTLIKNGTDHEIMDIKRFSDINTRIAYYVGGGAAIYAIIALTVGGLDLYIRH